MPSRDYRNRQFGGGVKRKTLQIAVTPRTFARVDLAAKKRNISRSWLLHLAITLGMEEALTQIDEADAANDARPSPTLGTQFAAWERQQNHGNSVAAT